MDNFRRSVIQLAEAVQVILMIVMTLAGGLVGMSWGRLIALSSGETGGAAFIGFIIGAGVGFIYAATSAALLFAMSETASNTAELVALFKPTNEHARSMPNHPATAPYAVPGTRREQIISKPRQDASSAANVETPSSGDGGIAVPQPDDSHKKTDIDVDELHRLLENWTGDDGERIIPMAFDVLTKAVQLGYEVSIKDNGELVLRSPTGLESYYRQNAHIIHGGRYLR